MPTGGRSSQHQWNEAASCLSFEIAASRMKSDGDMHSAQIFKRAAHLAISSLQRWTRPDGAWQIVKNWISPQQRHGYEKYSYFSQYNLLPAAILATAYTFADDSILEGWSIAETGGFVLKVDELNKVFANIGGNYLQVELFPDAPTNDALGLSRMHSLGMDAMVTGSSGAPSTAFGPVWEAYTGTSTHPLWESLATFSLSRLARKGELYDVKAESNKVSFSVKYHLKAAAVSAVHESYILTSSVGKSKGTVKVTVTLSPRIGVRIMQVGVIFPALTFDGRRHAEVDLSHRNRICHQIVNMSDTEERQLATCRQVRLDTLCGGNFLLSVLNSTVPTRNGLVSLIKAHTSTDGKACSLVYTFESCTQCASRP
jgi:hypothetical protein